MLSEDVGQESVKAMLNILTKDRRRLKNVLRDGEVYSQMFGSRMNHTT